jgi:aspartyl-tRNA(Asn)/glutamyl-tRNA(Gln) amidotransferase subunit B
MEKGEMRVEANISISPQKEKLGTKVEVKNLNSFRSVERAIKYEVDRMTKLMEEGKGEEIVQETRGWDDAKQKTFSQRKKEGSADYRYFPDPDLPKMKLHEAFDIKKMKDELPELPEEKRERFRKNFGIKDEDIETYINDPELGLWFEEVAKILNKKEDIQMASNFLVSDFLGLKKLKEDTKLPSKSYFAELVQMFTGGKISSRAAKDIFKDLIYIRNIPPVQIALNNNLLQINDENLLQDTAKKIIQNNEKVVADYKNGKEQALMSLLGQIMKETKGGANPEIAKKVLIDLLK